MAFFDKINNFAKSAGDKANEAIEIGKLNLKIKSENSAIDEKYKKLGIYYYDKYISGEALDDTAVEICKSIDISNTLIAETEKEIDNIKCAEPQTQETSQGKTKFCSECGAKLNSGEKFCSECGAKISE